MRRVSLPLFATIVAALLLAACGDDGDVPPATPTSAPPSAPVAALPTVAVASTAKASVVAATQPSTAACAFPKDGLGKTTVLSLTSGGLVREFRLHLPPTEVEARNGPVVLNFHGLGSNMLDQEIYSGLVPVSEREGFVLVTPNGTGATRGWQASAELPASVDDVQFVRDLLAALTRDYCIDTTATYSTGMSNGAFMSSRLACVLATRITAAAPVAGVYFPQEGCIGRTAILAFHGTDDGVVPFEPGLIFSVLPYAGARKGVAGWAAYNGCAPTPSKEDRLSDHVTRLDYGQCGGGADTSLVVVEGGGHTWPGAVDIPRLGETTKEVSAAEMIWAFFKAHPAGQ